MGLIRTPPNKNQHSPQKQQQQQQQQEQEQQQHELELEQQIDPFKRKPKLIRSPPPSQQRPNNTLTQIQNSTHTIISSVEPRNEHAQSNEIRADQQDLELAPTSQREVLTPLPQQAELTPPTQQVVEPPTLTNQQVVEQPSLTNQQVEQPIITNQQVAEQPALTNQLDLLLDNETHHRATKTLKHSAAISKPSPPINNITPNIAPSSHQQNSIKISSTLTNTKTFFTLPIPTSTAPPAITLPQPIKSQTIPKPQSHKPTHHKERTQDQPTKHRSRPRTSHNSSQPTNQQVPPKPTEPIMTSRSDTIQHPASSLHAFTSRKSLATDYDTSRESNTINLTSNVQIMTHRIEELEDLVKILETEKLINELTRELEEHQRAWDHEWDGSREKELNQTKLEKHVQSMQSSLEDREFQLALNSLKLRNMENQVSIKEYQTQELVKWMNEYQRQNQSRQQVLSSELERVRTTNTEWAQIGQNFESLIEIERREKEELQGRFEMELRQNQIEPNFEINTLKYQLIKAENRAEQLEEQLTETAQQSNTIQTQLIAQSALKDKLSRELELADCRIKSLSGQISDLTHSLSQLHKGEESNQRTLLQDLVAARTALAEKEHEIMNLSARLPGPTDVQAQSGPKRGRKKVGSKEQQSDEDRDPTVDDPVRLITSSSWVSIGAVAKKVSRAQLAKSTAASTTGSTTHDTEMGSLSKKGPTEDSSLRQVDTNHQLPKKRNPKGSRSKPPAAGSTETGQRSDASVPQNDAPVIPPAVLKPPPKKKKSKQLAQDISSKENVQQIEEGIDGNDDPGIEPEGEVEPDVELPEQPTNNTRAKKKGAKGKAKQTIPEQEEVPPLEADVHNESNEQAMVEQPAKSRPVRGKKAKKTVQVIVNDNNEDDDHVADNDDVNDERATVMTQQGPKKAVGARARVPRVRRKAGAVERAGEEDSDLIVTTNEENEDDGDDYGDPEIQAIAEQNDDDDDDSDHNGAPLVEQENQEPVPQKETGKAKKASGPTKRKGRQAAAAVPPTTHSPTPSPSPVSKKRKTKSGEGEGGKRVPAKESTRAPPKKATKKSQPPADESPDEDKGDAEPRKMSLDDDAEDQHQQEEEDVGAATSRKADEKSKRGKAPSKRGRAGAGKEPPQSHQGHEGAQDEDHDNASPPPTAPDHTARKGKKRKSASTSNTKLVAHPNLGREAEAEADDAAAVEETLNKKKRKIFHSKKPTLTWTTHQDDENNMLGLPPELSPVKKAATYLRGYLLRIIILLSSALNLLIFFPSRL
ncbi:hypothetical protein PCASD_06019 [Puccinia coronata f. sp. avenae]|uniref:Uncharacterized protein n=1 Tax=Puccinia coronata f. sp. avenae TaxID=200324 RepID=A0A2N5VA48_9BASI|nr:hypothetical protein PCASD_06019 [Puccinia coronata f. sp. avenae]